MNLIFKGKIVNEELKLNEPEAFKNYLKIFDGDEVNVSVKKFKPYNQRSNQQNRYYWGVVIKILADETGYTSDEMHSALAYQFLLTVGTRKLLPFVKSTAKLSTAEFEEYMTKVRSFASVELKTYIPTPNEVPFEY